MAEVSGFTDLGTANVNLGLTSYSGADGNNVPANVGGVDCRVNVSPDPHFYFGVDDAFAYGGNRRDVYITMQYYDNGTDWLALEYDSLLGGAYKLAPAFVFRQNTGTWKTYTWHLKDAFFANRQNLGADFRIVGVGTYYLNYVAIAAGNKVLVNLGTSNAQSGLTSYNGGDGNNLPANIGGLDCRQNAAGSTYSYFGIDYAWALTGDRQDLYITIHYFDNGTGWLRLEYDSTGGGAYKMTPNFNRQNSNTWKAKTWHITDAWCGKRQNFGADFRIAGSGTYYLDLVYARDFLPAARKRAMTPRFFNGTTYDSIPFRDLMSNLSQWPSTMAKIGTIQTIPDVFSSYTDTEAASWMMEIQDAGKMFEMEVPAIKTWGNAAQTFNAYKPVYDRIIALGGTLDGFNMDEPLFSVRHYGLGSDTYAVTETANWISYVRAWYPETKIGSIEPYSSINAASIEWWVAAVNNQCAAMGIEGLDSFVMDPYWAVYPTTGSYANSKSVCDWCQSNGTPFSMIYWAAKKHATDADWYTGIMQEGSGYQGAGLHPDRYMVESFLAVPVQTIPETQFYSFTKSVLDFFNTYAP